MIRTIKRIREKVSYILNKSQKSRDNDALLYFLYLDKFHGLSNKIGRDNAKKLYKIIKHAPFPETMSRARRKLQEEGEFLGKKRKERKKYEKEYRKEIKNVYKKKKYTVQYGRKFEI